MNIAAYPNFEKELKGLLEEIYSKYGVDFRHYAPASLKRTVEHAMNRMNCETLLVLQDRVLRDLDQFYDLLGSLTIPVSEMFRDPRYFSSLRTRVIPVLRTYPSLTIWVAGCSTGEEVFSLAILLEEEGLLERTRIFGTDINPKSLDRAIKGAFTLKEIEASAANYELAGGTRALLDYFEVRGDSAQFKGAFKKNITFVDHSLVTDAVFLEAHLISCRNVLIYFDRELQNRVFGLFRESLCRKCFLGLGANETMQFAEESKHFDTFGKEDRIYQLK